MAACFQVILTWSSLTTAKLFPFFFSPPPPPSLSSSLFSFVQGSLKDRAGERKQKRWPEVMARLDQRAGKFSNLASTCYGKLQGGREEGWRVRETSSGGDVCLAVYVTFPVVEIRNFAIHQMSKVSRLFCSYVDPFRSTSNRFCRANRFYPGIFPMFGYIAIHKPFRFRREHFQKSFIKTIHGRSPSSSPSFFFLLFRLPSKFFIRNIYTAIYRVIFI